MLNLRNVKGLTDDLRRLGFMHTLNDIFEAPDPVRSFMLSIYNVINSLFILITNLDLYV